ncbi:hypothetical protein F8M41_008362 [Gigaspora margarita]|uniref:Uncharacterized protein n=1 Tax=Gigaspora margarita TaxID=4874 RepID=A0A8H3X3M8_GIGMA|nr:hypothetical protein F8M41_008362 [Gigaspora margarita]
MYVTNEDRKEEALMIEESLNEVGETLKKVEETLKEVDIGVNQNDQKLDMIVQSINEVKQSTQKLNMIVQSIDLMQFKIDQFKHFKTDNLSSNIQAQRIGSNKLSSPNIFKVNNYIRDNGSVIKKFYGTIEVA